MLPKGLLWSNYTANGTVACKCLSAIRYLPVNVGEFACVSVRVCAHIFYSQDSSVSMYFMLVDYHVLFGKPT